MCILLILSESSFHHMGNCGEIKTNEIKTRRLKSFPWDALVYGSIMASCHVQYTQTDTTRQTDGPLVPMVGLVPIEKDVIPMVLLVNMHLIKGTWIILSCDLAGYRAISDGPLVPMVRLVPKEKHPIPMVLLVNMHLIKGTYITGQFPMVHWYQWYDWYQKKMMPFEWFYWCKTSSLLHQVETR